MTSTQLLPASEKVWKAIIDNGCPLTEPELEVETGLRPTAIHNRIKELLRQERIHVIKDNGAYLYGVKS